MQGRYVELLVCRCPKSSKKHVMARAAATPKLAAAATVATCRIRHHAHSSKRQSSTKLGPRARRHWGLMSVVTTWLLLLAPVCTVAKTSKTESTDGDDSVTGQDASGHGCQAEVFLPTESPRAPRSVRCTICFHSAQGDALLLPGLAELPSGSLDGCRAVALAVPRPRRGSARARGKKAYVGMAYGPEERDPVQLLSQRLMVDAVWCMLVRWRRPFPRPVSRARTCATAEHRPWRRGQSWGSG